MDDSRERSRKSRARRFLHRALACEKRGEFWASAWSLALRPIMFHNGPVQSYPAKDRVVIGFIAYLKVEKGLAPLTIAAYERDLADFQAHLESTRHKLTSAKREDVKDFLERLTRRGLDGRSIARKISTLRHFYKHLLLDRQIKQDPTLNIDSPKQWKVLPKALSAEEVENVLKPKASGSKNQRISKAITLRDAA